MSSLERLFPLLSDFCGLGIPSIEGTCLALNAFGQCQDSPRQAKEWDGRPAHLIKYGRDARATLCPDPWFDM